MCAYVCIGFIDFKLKGQNLLSTQIYFLSMIMKGMTKEY